MLTPRILVIEDEVIVARTITKQLQQLGYTIAGTASSGAAAIAKAVETQPDLILMDIVLKGEMDGVAAAAQIREQRDIPVIYLTAYTDDHTLQRAKLTQPFGYIVKPFTTHDLRVAVEIGLYKHQIAQELQENRDQLATLLKSMGDAVIATDAEGSIAFMNQVAEQLTEWTQAEALGKPATEVFRLIDEITERAAPDPIQIVLQNQERIDLDAFTALITKNGTRIPIGDSASPLKRSTGDVSGVVVVFRDMRDRRQAELLSQALEKERELNHLKTQFVSTVSHEFRNPLAAILIATNLLESAPNLSDVKKRFYLQRIKTSVSSMNQLMEDILVLGQADVNRLRFTPGFIDLDQVCRTLVDEFALLKDKDCAITYHSPGGETQVWMDEKLLRYILTNLLSNAIKYSPAQATIQFHVQLEADATLAIFRIQDQGIGIPAAEQSRLFDSFFRASNVTSIQGTGLGLAIVKRCVEAHQGQIAVSSQVGVGTTVEVVLPCQRSAAVSSNVGSTSGG